MNYSDFVARLKKPGTAIVDSITPLSADAMHMAIGISGEAGELLDAIKKWVIYDKPVDLNNLIEELGDLEFYMEGIRQVFGLTREEIISTNQEKLSLRYSGGKYTNQAAINRADKQI